MPAAASAFDAPKVLQTCREIVAAAQLRDPAFVDFDSLDFLEGARFVAWLLQQHPDLRPRSAVAFAEGLRKLEGDYAREVERDPMLLYRPAHEVALAFHSSRAHIRCFFSGNRCGKTQSGFSEHYFVATGQHKWRAFMPPPTASFIVGVNFNQYAPSVFETKFLKVEPDNPLSPMFPEGGKWLHHYDDRKHTLHIACVDCAREGKARECKHPLSVIRLFSDIGGAEVLQGAQYNLGHFDEHIAKAFFAEAMQRLKTVRQSSFIITETPLLGQDSWEYEKLVQVFEDPKKNKFPGSDDPLVSVHNISQFAAGLVPHEQIHAEMKLMDEFEIESRIYGRFVAVAPHGVFDRFALQDMRRKVRTPKQGRLLPVQPKEGEELPPPRPGTFAVPRLELHELPEADLSVWEKPEPGAQYLIGCDVASGLTHRDYSCAVVLRIPDLRMVASLHGWINPLEYARRLFDLGHYYNSAMLIVERTGGLGIATLTKLKELGYWNLFRDLSDPSQVALQPDSVFGIDTNIKTKGHMVSCLQQTIQLKHIDIPCSATISELVAFTQETTDSGLSTRYEAAAGAKDDRVMALVLVNYVAVTYPQFNFAADLERIRRLAEKPDDENARKWENTNREIKLAQERWSLEEENPY